jgi:hypothetical protein
MDLAALELCEEKPDDALPLLEAAASLYKEKGHVVGLRKSFEKLREFRGPALP